MAALESWQIAGVVLDVFREEPLPKQSAFWTHPRVIVTPHVAAEAACKIQAAYIANAIQEIEAGKTPELTYRPEWGY